MKDGGEDSSVTSRLRDDNVIKIIIIIKISREGGGDGPDGATRANWSRRAPPVRDGIVSGRTRLCICNNVFIFILRRSLTVFSRPTCRRRRRAPLYSYYVVTVVNNFVQDGRPLHWFVERPESGDQNKKTKNE